MTEQVEDFTNQFNTVDELQLAGEYDKLREILQRTIDRIAFEKQRLARHHEFQMYVLAALTNDGESPNRKA